MPKRKRSKRRQQYDSDRYRRRQAAHRRQVRTDRIIDMCDGLADLVLRLDDSNYPPVNLPHMHTSSVMDISRARSCTGDVDPAIERYLDTLYVDIMSRIERAGRLLRDFHT